MTGACLYMCRISWGTVALQDVSTQRAGWSVTQRQDRQAGRQAGKQAETRFEQAPAHAWAGRL
jgi:hypothetical protein